MSREESEGCANEAGLAARIGVIATSFMVLLTIVGFALYGLPFYYDFIVHDLHWSRAQVTSGNGLSKLLVGPAFGFLAGWFIDRFGPKRMMIAGILMAGVALVGLGRMSTLSMFYLCYLMNALGYVCGGPLPNQVLLSEWFDRARGKAMGFAYLGIGLGGAIVPLLSVRLVAHFGWHRALEGLGLLIIVVALPMALLVKSPPEKRAARSGSRSNSPIRPVLKSPQFYLLAIGSMCSIAAIGGCSQHLKLYLSIDRGYAQQEAALVVSLMLGFSLGGRLIMGWLADRMPRKYVMVLIYSLVAAAVPLLFLASHRSAIFLFAAIFGIGLGGDYMIIPLMGADLFGVAVLGRLMGIVLTADGIAEAVSPMLVGFLRDRTGSYTSSFVFLIAVALAGAAAVGMLRSRTASPRCPL